jgi:hypothetical protein
MVILTDFGPNKIIFVTDLLVILASNLLVIFNADCASDRFIIFNISSIGKLSVLHNEDFIFRYVTY